MGVIRSVSWRPWARGRLPKPTAVSAGLVFSAGARAARRAVWEQLPGPAFSPAHVIIDPFAPTNGMRLAHRT
jgi:hypothetical protein